jgi:hypothetical protein
LPIRAAEVGASIVGHTINYRFARDRLLHEHPFGLLHKITSEFSVAPRPAHTELELAIGDPERFLVSVLGNPQFYPQLLAEFWLAHEAAAYSFARVLADPTSLREHDFYRLLNR